MNIAKVKCAGLALFLLLSAATVLAQDVHYVQFDATPLAVNPAFTGMFDGSIRASYLYRNQWSGIIPYVTHVGSFDMPVIIDKKHNYLAAGMQYARNFAGDGSLNNFSGLLSVAYHKHFGAKEAVKGKHTFDLGIGLQGGYIQKSINVTSLFFGDEYPWNIIFFPGHGTFVNRKNYYGWAAGFGFSQSIGRNFKYTVGLSENNINQPKDEQNDYVWLGINRNTTGLVRADWLLNRLSIRPSVYFMAREKLTAFIAGSEFHYTVSKKNNSKKPTAIFFGAWYRKGGVIAITSGVELRNFRIGIGFEDYSPVMNNAYSSGIELSVKYVMPASVFGAKKRSVPGSRF